MADVHVQRHRQARKQERVVQAALCDQEARFTFQARAYEEVVRTGKKTILHALEELINSRASTLNFETCYRAAYSLTMRKQGDWVLAEAVGALRRLNLKPTTMNGTGKWRPPLTTSSCSRTRRWRPGRGARRPFRRPAVSARSVPCSCGGC